MRIVEVAAQVFPSPQGSQVLLRETCEALHEAGHDVHLVTYAEGEAEFSPPYRHTRVGGRWPRFDSMRSGPKWQKAVRDAEMARALGHIEGDVFHVHGPEALLAAKIARRAPTLYHVHTRFDAELPTYATAGPLGKALAAVGVVVDRALPLWADHRAVVSENLVGVAGGPARVTVVPPAIRIPEQPNPPLSRRVVGYAGNLDGYQGLALLLDALALLPEANLRVVTASDPRPLYALAGERGVMGRVEILPHRSFEEVLATLAGCEALVVTRSIPGGFPMKLLAYLAAGRPVVAVESAAHGAPVVEVPDGDAPALADAIGGLLGDPRRASDLGRRGRAHLETTYTHASMVRALEAAFVRTQARREPVTVAGRRSTSESTPRAR